jgi:hypothetical protein
MFSLRTSGGELSATETMAHKVSLPGSIRHQDLPNLSRLYRPKCAMSVIISRTLATASYKIQGVDFRISET